MGCYQLTPARFAPAKAGARAHLRGCAAPVGSQAFCSRFGLRRCECWGEFIGVYQLTLARFAPAEAGARADASRRIASVLQQDWYTALRMAGGVYWRFPIDARTFHPG